MWNITVYTCCFAPCFAVVSPKMHPGALKILKFSREWPPTPPSGVGTTPSHTDPNLVLRAKMVAPPPYFLPAIATFVPMTSNLNKNPASGRLQEVKNSGKLLAIKPKKWLRPLTGGGHLKEVPTVRL